MALYRRWELTITFVLIVYYYVFVVNSDDLHITADLQRRLKVLPQPFIYNQPPLNKSLAYVQYATDITYFQLSIHNLNSLSSPRGNLVIVFNRELIYNPKFDDLQALALAKGIILIPVDVLTIDEKNIWHDSFTKLYVFSLIQYDRVIYFDADSMLLDKPREPTNLNELFNIPEDIDIAMPQAYWLSNQQLRGKPQISQHQGQPLSLFSSQHKFQNRKSFFASHVIVLKPNLQVYHDLLKYVYNPWWWSLTVRSRLRAADDYDMEILNKFIDDNLQRGTMKFGIIDHRIYGVLTGEFREQYHSKFVCDPQHLPFISHQSNEGWNGTDVIQHAKLVHFSDEPIPKPWLPENNIDHYNTFKIYCDQGDMQEYKITYLVNKPRLVTDCDSVDIWNWLRQKFRLNYIK